MPLDGGPEKPHQALPTNRKHALRREASARHWGLGDHGMQQATGEMTGLSTLKPRRSVHQHLTINAQCSCSVNALP